jgi:hypothetical protein
MKCKYEYEVRAQCPCNTSDTDVYQFTIDSESIILVEKIAEFFDKHAKNQNVFQEDLTQKCAVTLGARVTSVGWHHGIKVTVNC